MFSNFKDLKRTYSYRITVDDKEKYFISDKPLWEYPHDLSGNFETFNDENQKKTISNEIKTIVSYHNKNKSVKNIKTISDIIDAPNSELISNVITEENLDSKQLYNLFNKPKEIENLLYKHLPKEVKEEDLSHDHIDQENLKDINSFANSIRSYGYDITFNFGDSLLVGIIEEAQITLPSGKDIYYNLISKEFSVNTSIFNGGYSRVLRDKIYVRRNFVTMMEALIDYFMNDFHLSKKEVVKAKSFIPAAVIGHEIGEIEIGNYGRPFKDSKNHEVDCELFASEYMQNHGYDFSLVCLFHRIRSKSMSNKGENNSKKFLKILSE